MAISTLGTGEVVVWPAAQTLAGYHCLQTSRPRAASAVAPVEGMTIMANISRASEVVEALNMLARRAERKRRPLRRRPR